MRQRQGTSGFSGMVSLLATGTVLLSAVLSIAATGGTVLRIGRTGVSVRAVNSDGYIELIVENHRLHDITLTLTITSDNVAVSRLKPETATYPSQSSVAAVRWSVADAAKWSNPRYQFTWVKGAMNVKHDDHVLYRLPFESGTSHRVAQGYDGIWSHKDSDRYAVDFAMPEGTVVCAARDGLVVDLYQFSENSGVDEKDKFRSNYVSILHDDGTIAEYLHLQYKGVLVKTGQRVTAGTSIATSGNTGYTTWPHLHFGVYSAVDGTHTQSHPVIFTTRQGVVAEPLEGRLYTAR
jgi:murein DD-endopeptidase MepM/ murein hydrolase activator NlpD